MWRRKCSEVLFLTEHGQASSSYRLRAVRESFGEYSGEVAKDLDDHDIRGHTIQSHVLSVDYEGSMLTYLNC